MIDHIGVMRTRMRVKREAPHPGISFLIRPTGLGDKVAGVFVDVLSRFRDQAMSQLVSIADCIGQANQ